MDKQIKVSKPNCEQLSAHLQPETLNSDTRSVDCIWYTGVDVQRMDWTTGQPYILQFDPSGVDLSILNNGAPVLDDHDSFSGVAGQMGVVEKAWVAGSNYMATLRFSRRPEVDGLWQDIQDKIVTKFSMGTEIVAKQDVTPDNSLQKVVRATQWRPYEISLAPLAADMNTTTLLSESNDFTKYKQQNIGAEAHEELISMSEPIKSDVAVETPKAESVNLEAERAKGRADAAEILSRCNAAKLSTEFATQLIADGKSVEDASKRIFVELAKRDAATETRSQVTVTRDEGDTRREQMTSALLHRVNPAKFNLETGNEFRHMSMLRMAEECLSATGQRVRGLAPSEVARLALHSTSDFPNILAAGANKTLLAAYEYANPSYKRWAKPATVPDFKTVNRVRLGEFPVLESVAEGGEIHYGSMSEGKESYAIGTFAKIFGITRQAIVNDDLGAFASFAGPIGTQVALLENKTVYAILNANAAMADGTALFHANHNNLGTGAIAVAGLDAGQAAMMKQTGLDGVSVLNIVPRFLIVPVAKRVTAIQYTNVPNILYTKSSDFNPFAGQLEVIADACLDGTSTSVWYLAADPAMGAVEYATLEGNSGPQISSRVGFEVDGVEIKAVHDFGAKAIEYRAMFKSSGV